MSDQPIAIKLGADQTEGHGAIVGSTSDDRLLKAISDSGKRVQIRIPETDDTEGHVLSTTIDVVVSTDDDDVEGHAMSLHFPSIAEANDFRRRVTAAGLITATIAVGAVGATAAGSALIGAAGNASTAPGDYSGQYSVQNLGGTQWAGATSTNLGQYTVQNPGGTPAQAGSQASNLGQYSAENPGGTPAQAQSQASSSGQYSAENPGGTPAQGGTYEGQYSPANPGGVVPSDTESAGQYDPANMGGTPQAPNPDEGG